jgi:hypothetical protein
VLASCLVLKTVSVRWRPLKNRPSFDPHKLRYPQFVSYSIYFMAEVDSVQFPKALRQQPDQSSWLSIYTASSAWASWRCSVGGTRSTSSERNFGGRARVTIAPFTLHYFWYGTDKIGTQKSGTVPKIERSVDGAYVLLIVLVPVGRLFLSFKKLLSPF